MNKTELRSKSNQEAIRLPLDIKTEDQTVSTAPSTYAKLLKNTPKFSKPQCDI